MTYIYVMPLHEEHNGYGTLENGGYGIPPSNHTPPNDSNSAQGEAAKPNGCTRFFPCCRQCKCCKKQTTMKEKKFDNEEVEKSGCFACLTKKNQDQVRINIENEEGPKKKCWDRLKCCGRNKVGSTTGCCSSSKRNESWEERRDSILSTPTPPKSRCSKDCCGNVLRKIFCLNLCCKKKALEDPVSRKASLMSKKKSLTPTTIAPPPEDNSPKLDMSLVEYQSHMKGAIPVLPVYLAWFCLFFNCIGPGTGTVFSGLFCLCLGIPRFTQRDGAKPRIGAFVINLVIGFGQFFTVLFCLVGWGWSIWWGVIMIKVAKKYRKLKELEAIEEANANAELALAAKLNQKKTERVS